MAGIPCFSRIVLGCVVLVGALLALREAIAPASIRGATSANPSARTNRSDDASAPTAEVSASITSRVHREGHWRLTGSIEGHGGALLGAASACVVRVHESGPILTCTKSNQSGAFVLASLSSDVIEATAFADGYVGQNVPIDELADDGASGRTVRFVLRRSAFAITGYVVDMTGGAIAGALVTARSAGSPSTAVAVSDGTGAFSIGVAQRQVELGAALDGYVGANVQVTAPHTEVALPMVPSSGLGGRVTSEIDGSPVPGVTLTATNVDGLKVRPATATSDGEGNYRFVGLPPGRYELLVESSHWFAKPRWTGLGVGEVRADVDMSVSFAASITLVVTVGNEPCRHGHLELRGPVNLAGAPVADGKVVLEGVALGRYHASVGCVDPPSEETAAEFEVEGAITQAWDLERDRDIAVSRQDECCPELGTLRVRVNGESALRMRPIVTSASGFRVANEFRDDEDAQVSSDLPVGTYRVHLEQYPEAQAWFALERPGQVAQVTFDVPGRTTIAGRVLDEMGNPVPDAWVHAELAGQVAPGVPTVAADDGTFLIEGLLPTSYRLVAETALAQAVMPRVRGGTHDVALAVSQYVSVEGKVLDDQGIAESFSLAYRREEDSFVGTLSGYGSWNLPWIPAGSYQFVAIADSGAATEAVTLGHGREPVELTFTTTLARSSELPSWAMKALRITGDHMLGGGRP